MYSWFEFVSLEKNKKVLYKNLQNMYLKSAENYSRSLFALQNLVIYDITRCIFFEWILLVPGVTRKRHIWLNSSKVWGNLLSAFLHWTSATRWLDFVFKVWTSAALNFCPIKFEIAPKTVKKVAKSGHSRSSPIHISRIWVWIQSFVNFIEHKAL